MRHARTIVLAMLALTLAGASLLAHPMTYKGTVTSIEGAKLKVNVIDDSTKKESAMDFDITAKTKIYRGDKVVKAADAHIQKNERIAVTVDHDQPGHDATEIRLAAAEK